MNRIYASIYAVALLLFVNQSFAQHELYGSVKDMYTKNALAGVSVYIPDLKVASISDANGNFRLKNIPTGKFLVVTSLVGYATNIENIYFNEKVNKEFLLAASVNDLQEVVVTGVPSATSQRTNPVPMYAISSNELLQQASSNIIDAIAFAPGVSQITDGPAISKPVIRGLGYNRVVVINDGVRQEGQQWGDEFGIEIDGNTVDHVEVLKGPASLRYGSDAMAGVINFLSPEPLPEGVVKGNLLAGYQTNNGLYNLSANIAGNNNGFIYDVRYSNSSAHAYHNKYDGYVWNSAYAQSDAKAIVGVQKKWGYSLLHLDAFDQKLGIVEGARDEETGQFTKTVLASDGSDSAAIAPVNEYKKYGFFPIIHQHIRHYKAVLDNSFNIGASRLAVKLGFQKNYRQEANDITKGDIFNNYFFLQTLNYDVQFILPEKNHTAWSFGVNGMQQNSEDRGVVYLVPEYNSFDVGVYALGKKTINQLTLSGGIRFDSRTLHGHDLFTDESGFRVSQLDQHATLRFAKYNSDFAGLSGSLGAAYDFNKAWYGKLNFSRGFRAPNIAESGSNGIHDGTPFYEIGDPNLKPENSLQIDATIGVHTEDFTSELNLFRNQINNYIFPVKLGSVLGGDSISTDIAAGMEGPTFKYISGDAVLSGGEFLINFHPHNLPWLHWNNSFSMIRAIQQHQGDSTKYLPYTPPQKLQSQIKLVWQHVGSGLQNVYFSVGLEANFKQDKIYYRFGDETVTLGYTLLNAGIGGDICAKKKVLFSVYLQANNLGDVAYQSNMSRLKYGDTNNATGRIGVFNMGRNMSIKMIVPIEFKK